MKKIEFIWRHLLDSYLDSRLSAFRQQDLASHFHLSSSTANLALKPLRELGAVRVHKRGFEITDFHKILYHWANHRRLSADLVAQIRVNLPVMEIEGRLPDGSLTTAYSAVRERFGEPPTDYDKVYCYHPQPQSVIDRFAPETLPGPPNLFVLQANPFLKSLFPKESISLSQLFVDLWGLSDWYAKDFVTLVKSKIDELLP